MSAPDIKSCHDRIIRRMLAEGAIRREVMVATGLSGSRVESRSIALGVRLQMTANGQARRMERRRARLAGRALRTQWNGFHGSKLAKSLMEPRVDRTASDLVSRLRVARADVAALGYDPTHLIASFHAAGLTLDDIEECFGIPPVVAASAIRRANHIGLS